MEKFDHLTTIRTHLIALYGESEGQAAFERANVLLNEYRGRIPAARLHALTQHDAILITYGDQVTQPGQVPLQSLADFCHRHLTGVISSIHTLPFYPYTSDDGFSIIDYRSVNPSLGSWADIERFRQRFHLMFDAVINHLSASSDWFQRFLHGDLRYRDYFIAIPDGADLSQVIRPRALPLSTPFVVEGRLQNLWTTFSSDQVDLNYHNPAVLLDVLDVLLSYIEHGAEFIRLDAIAFLWKTYGTTCLHLPQTHSVIQLIRAVLDEIAPHVILITETNVPHADNLSYFGNGYNEAQMVYNFALPPLVLHTLHTENAERLTQWAKTLVLPSKRTTFFNFLASHDGIGLNPVNGILSPEEIGALTARVQAHGGLVSYKNNPNGSTSPYELNVNYFDALNDPQEGSSSFDLQVKRFMAAQAMILALVGVPGIYFHSLFGSRGWPEGVQKTGQNRTINRQKNQLDQLEAELADPGSIRHQVLKAYSHLLRIRAAQPAFDPFGQMVVLDVAPQVFALLRVAGHGQPVLCLQNVSAQSQRFAVPFREEMGGNDQGFVDLISGQPVDSSTMVGLEPYQTMWLTR